MTVVAIHQPVYLPWLGFFKKMMDSDVFVFMDDVQYEKKEWFNKNQIAGMNGPTWLTVPVQAHLESKLNEVKIDNSKNWAKKHKKSILYSYTKTPFFEDYKNFIDQLYDKNFDSLIEINMEIIEFIKKNLDIDAKTIFASELQISGTGSDRVLNICKAMNADNYITGTVWAKDNLRVEDFTKNNISVKFQNFQHPVYKQIHDPFLPNMAVIDLLFNEGKNASKVLHDSKMQVVN